MTFAVFYFSCCPVLFPKGCWLHDAVRNHYWRWWSSVWLGCCALCGTVQHVVTCQRSSQRAHQPVLANGDYICCWHLASPEQLGPSLWLCVWLAHGRHSAAVYFLWQMGSSSQAHSCGSCLPISAYIYSDYDLALFTYSEHRLLSQLQQVQLYRLYA